MVKKLWKPEFKADKVDGFADHGLFWISMQDVNIFCVCAFALQSPCTLAFMLCSCDSDEIAPGVLVQPVWSIESASDDLTLSQRIWAQAADARFYRLDYAVERVAHAFAMRVVGPPIDITVRLANAPKRSTNEDKGFLDECKDLLVSKQPKPKRARTMKAKRERKGKKDCSSLSNFDFRYLHDYHYVFLAVF
jgi:hypothetical protein